MILGEIVVLVSILLKFQVNALNKYCYLMCEEDHIMCRFKSGGPKLCKTFYHSGLSLKQKQMVLNEHNRLRQRVALGRESYQPSATNMMSLTWDDEGANIAQRWADQCDRNGRKDKVIRNICRSKLNDIPGGQNMVVEPIQVNDLNNYFIRHINSWFQQNLNFIWSDKYVYSTNSAKYSQIVWSTTTSVGCGFSYNITTTDYMYRFVCNYYPNGNIADARIYEKGLACSECPEGSSCSKTWPGLCTTNSMDMGGILPNETINTEASASAIHPFHILFIFEIMFMYFH